MGTLGSDFPAPAGAAAVMQMRTPVAAAAEAGCYHCGQPMPADTPWHTTLGDVPAAFCCAGCQALAETIHAGGFGHLYRADTRFATPLEGAALQDAERRWQAYDAPELMAQFTRPVGDDVLECTLAVEQLRCAACVWLIEQTLEKLPGVQSVQVNFSTGRATVRWRRSTCQLSSLLRRMAEIGYPAWPFEAARSDAHARRERRSLLMRLGVAMLGMMQVMMYAWPVYTHAYSIDPDHLTLLRWASLLLTLPVVLYSAQPIFSGAWRDLRRRHLGMDVPVALGIGAAFLASLAATILDRGDVWYDSVTMFVAFLLAARYLELRARQSARSGAEALARQLPATVERLDASGSAEVVPVVRLRHGDRIRIRPGETIPADGVVQDGQTDVDESLLSGESLPVPRTTGDAVLAGSFNCSSPIVVEVTEVGAGTRLAGIVQLLDRALAERPPAAVMADRVASVFVLVLLILAALSGLVWWWIDPSRALQVMVTVLVVSCPCALSLATPAALAAAHGALARCGLLVTRGRMIETLAGVSDVMLDKTGTLTHGRFMVADIVTFGPASAEACLALMAGMEQASEHPLARALCTEAAQRGIAPVAAGTVRAVPGRGMTMDTPQGEVRIGSLAFTQALYGGEGASHGIAAGDAKAWAGTVAPSPAAGQTRIWLADTHGPLACVTLQDTLREAARSLLDDLREQGCTVHLVSGDAPATVAWWAGELGIVHAAGGVSPEDKRAYVQALQAQGKTVLAVGDGINDAPVLAQADASIAIGSGAPLAQAGADAVLNGGDIGVVGTSLAFARKARRVIRQNLGWAFAYNVTAIPLAMVGWMPPWLAAIGMSLSSLLVVGNAWRLSRGAHRS